MSILKSLHKLANYLDKKGAFEFANIIDRKLGLLVQATPNEPEIRKVIQSISSNISQRALTEIYDLTSDSEYLLENLKMLVSQSISGSIDELVANAESAAHNLDALIKKQNSKIADSVNQYVEEKLINLNQDVLEILLKAGYLGKSASNKSVQINKSSSSDKPTISDAVRDLNYVLKDIDINDMKAVKVALSEALNGSTRYNFLIGDGRSLSLFARRCIEARKNLGQCGYKKAADANQIHPPMMAMPSYKPITVNKAPQMTNTEHNAIGLAGLAPFLGEGFDLVNALAYAEEGKFIYSALSLVSMIPGIGDSFGKGTILIIKISELLGKRLGPKVVIATLSEAEQVQLEGLKNLYDQNQDTVNKVFNELGKVPVFGPKAKEMQAALNGVMSIL